MTARRSDRKRRLGRWALALPVLALLVLAYQFRPLTAVDGDAGDLGPERRPLLVDATDSAAVVLSPGGESAGSRPALTSHTRAGRQLWRSEDAAERMLYTCGDGCETVFGSASSDSFVRPEVADPAVLKADASGDAELDLLGPRHRVLWAGGPGSSVVNVAGSLSDPLVVTSVSGRRTVPLVKDATGDALFLSDGDDAVVLTHPTPKTASVVFARRGADGWAAVGSPVAVPGWGGGCFGRLDDGPVAVVYDETGARLVRPSGSVALPASGGTGACAVTSAGPVLASFASTEEATVLSQRDPSGVELWSVRLPGLRNLSGTASRGTVAATDATGEEVRLLDARGQVQGTRKAVGAKLVDSGLVLLGADGVPRWEGLP